MESVEADSDVAKIATRKPIYRIVLLDKEIFYILYGSKKQAGSSLAALYPD
ncbi:hypothetical protein QUF75_17900 [Desulfococcaceae bacterium HSG7]|nr:hypothetical protein [Desulfococcaceae bacterium HSG7]